MAHFKRVQAANITSSGLVAGGQPVTIHGYSYQETGGTTNLTLVGLTGANLPNRDNSTYNPAITGSATAVTGFDQADSGDTQVFGEVITKALTSVGGTGWPAEGVYFPYGIYLGLSGGVAAGTIWYS